MVANMAVEATPADHPDRASCLGNLGTFLRMRFERTGSTEDLNRALLSYENGWKCHNSAPLIRIHMARAAATILASQSSWAESSLLLQEAIKLLLVVNSRSLQNTDKQHILTDFTGLASMAAATALNAEKEAYTALQLLELGRGIIAGLLLETRMDISALDKQHPQFAKEFVSLRDELDSPTDGTDFVTPIDNAPSWVSRANQRREAEQNFNQLLTRIRAQPGFKNFLLPPTVQELMAAANPDPIIVVNASSYRCDAFLIERSQIRVLELPGLTLKELQERARKLRLSRFTGAFSLLPLLEWLWDVVAGPCLDALGFKNPICDDTWPRVWWIPTGILSQLPLHAAGRHRGGSTETVLDRVMSSYASSIKALIHGCRQRGQNTPPSDRALLISMSETPGLPMSGSLPFTKGEVEMLTNLCPSLQLKPVQLKVRKEDVLKQLQDCRIFHFAGHGRSDPMEPSQSCLLLEDWQINPLTVGDLRDHRLQENPPFLGYLSACSTGANEADELVDEGIHLISALQLAGFRHVIGTLWEVSDEHCVDVARVVYETIRDEGMTDVAVCRGLHRAVRALRDGRIESSGEGRTATLVSCGAPAEDLLSPYWIPYVHFGV
ncbi:hypothetical protein DM02DRAFT_698160 [Periconia macrospinosa]|uniref:CHAT domain-containing protein n=1 Tax=Periconia macrospinosa TaxID=97972 RepID=A0A2V1E1E3_9PLEO|nr:hypothetical protein DM02DRAFT_698160 [Periconia macrospinosa]